MGFRGQGLRRMLGDYKRLFCATIILLYYRYLFPPPADKVLALPVSGHLCLKVHSGYKIFDFRRSVVIKVFSPTSDPAKVQREIVWVRRVGAHRFAPTVHRWSVEERWYEEDYVNGFPAADSDWRKSLHTLQESVVPLVARMILAAPSQKVRALEYALDRSELVLGEQSILSDERLDATKVQRIRSFVQMMIERLRQEGDRPLSLVYSHGDFCPKHILTTKHGAVIIDWEAAGYRSALFDLYHAFFRRLWGGEGVAPGMAVAMEQAISELQLALQASDDNSSLCLSLDAAKVYRWIYYVERICLYVETRGKRMTERHVNKTLLFIDACNYYEEHLMDGIGQIALCNRYGAMPV